MLKKACFTCSFAHSSTGLDENWCGCFTGMAGFFSCWPPAVPGTLEGGLLVGCCCDVIMTDCDVMAEVVVVLVG